MDGAKRQLRTGPDVPDSRDRLYRPELSSLAAEVPPSIKEDLCY